MFLTSALKQCFAALLVIGSSSLLHATQATINQPTTAAAPVATNSAPTGNYAAATTAASPAAAEPTSAAEQENRIKAMVNNQAGRLKQLEQANLDALTQNQELQLKNDNLAVQVQVLQSERSAQMFLYGGATLAVGVILGFLLASYIYTKRRRQW